MVEALVDAHPDEAPLFAPGRRRRRRSTRQMTIPDEWTMADIERLLARGDPADLVLIPIAITNLGTPDAQWSEAICLALAEHTHPAVRANAVLGLGHLARVTGTLNRARAAPVISAALHDAAPSVRQQAATAAGDVWQFLGWPELEPPSGNQDVG